MSYCINANKAIMVLNLLKHPRLKPSEERDPEDMAAITTNQNYIFDHNFLIEN